MNSALWTLEQVTLGQRLREIWLPIGTGVTAVLGHSGAGKTSLLNLLVGFERPDTGRVVSHVERGARARPLFWVPQEYGLWPHMTVREHVASMGGAEPDGLLEEFDLLHRSAARPATLSQGERARLAVARALAADAAVLVMDEPLAHVDPARVGQYWHTLRRHTAEAGVSLVFSTHTPGTVLAEAGQVVCLQDSRVTYAGGVKELYWTPPSVELATCLGEVNWLTAAEVADWLPGVLPGSRCLRPEQLAVRPATEGPLRVVTARFHGGVAEVELRHESRGMTRRFWHRPSGPHLSPGACVALEVL